MKESIELTGSEFDVGAHIPDSLPAAPAPEPEGDISDDINTAKDMLVEALTEAKVVPMEMCEELTEKAWNTFAPHFNHDLIRAIVAKHMPGYTVKE